MDSAYGTNDVCVAALYNSTPCNLEQQISDVKVLANYYASTFLFLKNMKICPDIFFQFLCLCQIMFNGNGN